MIMVEVPWHELSFWRDPLFDICICTTTILVAAGNRILNPKCTLLVYSTCTPPTKLTRVNLSCKLKSTTKQRIVASVLELACEIQ
jgi:hypothetical protein